MLGLRHGDLSVSRPWNVVVRVSTSTTHPAMAELLHRIFDKYGRVYEIPRYKRDTRTYEWNLCVILDGSFDFLDLSIRKARRRVSRSRQRVLAYVSGVLDAEGHIGISRNYKTTSIIVSIYNTNRAFLSKLKRSLSSIGLKVLGIYLDKTAGTVGGNYGIIRRKDHWRIAITDFAHSQNLLSKVRLMHSEKLGRKNLALKLRRGESWSLVGPLVKRESLEIHRARDEYVKRAERLVRMKSRKRRPMPP
jgi:hypothetical protein